MAINDPVKPNQSQQKKDELRQKLEQDIKDYLAKGKKIITALEVRHHQMVRKKKALTERCQGFLSPKHLGILGLSVALERLVYRPKPREKKTVRRCVYFLLSHLLGQVPGQIR